MALSIVGLSKSYATSGGVAARVLDDVSLAVAEGEAVGLVGESGSGKTTLVRCALRLLLPDAGRVEYDGIDVIRAEGSKLMLFRREVQVVFQDPYASLNPRMTIEELIGEGLIVHCLERCAAKRRARVSELLQMIGLDPADMHRYPRAFSGGQRQRIAIARALAVQPRILVCDEPVSALDVSIQAQVINLLQDMQRELRLGILFVGHDLGVVRHLCSSILVLHHGQIVERGSTKEVFGAPRHPYTISLLEAVPIPDPIEARRKRALRRKIPCNQPKV
jgi:ABC-type oligopeptide transport system ATPase subunit